MFVNFKERSKSIKVDVYINRILLEIERVIRNIARGNLNSFHTRERNLYQPLIDELSLNLPSSNLVEQENILYKNQNSSQATDISIRKLFDINKAKKDRTVDYSHFIEIKKIFHNDTLTKTDIDDDLEKLAECTKNYNSIGFFVLVGLDNDLNINKNSYKHLDINNKNAFDIKTKHQQTIWLKASGTKYNPPIKVYIWEVSHQNKFGQYRTSYSYLMNQVK